MTTNEIVGCVTMIVAIIGLIFSCYQWWKKVQLERAERLSKLITLLRNDVRQLSILYKIDYGESWYDESFHKSELEGELDRFLSFYEYILYLRMNCIISEKEFRFFEYDIMRIVKNSDLRSYLFNLYQFCRDNKLTFPYQNVVDYGMQNGYIQQSFFE
jgi:hypothetical protein